MDFAWPLESEESIATKSKIRYLPVPEATVDGTEKFLDGMLQECANEAATDILLGPIGDFEKLDCALVDASLYTERTRPVHTTIRAGDLVVIMESFDKLDFVYAEIGAIYSNRNGHFHHEDFIGRPFGGKIRSKNNRGYGFCHLLKPTPELWARSLNHRTQIVHELDQAQIIFQLQLRPNFTVVESGTGSGAMSHSVMRTIAPHGLLHTYEFNAGRAESAATEFRKNGVSHLVRVHHKDVCGKGCRGGFDLPGQSVDAVFLDLPEPWLAVPHAAFILKANARIATYSPCVEQTQKTVEALKQAGFHSTKTMEYRLQEHYVDEVEYESPPIEKRPRMEPYNPRLAESSTAPADTDDTGAEADNEKSEMSETEAVTVDTSTTATVPPSVRTVAPTTSSAPSTGGVLNGIAPAKRKKQVVARPKPTMRGHTAFLTFATAGNVPQANPNKEEAEAVSA
jgi:tRNA (adenine57-N1/adenine58-N1)-methyltransferase